MLKASWASSRIRTKRCQPERSPTVSARNLRRKAFRNFRISFTCNGGNQGAGGGRGIGQEHVFEFVGAGRENSGPLADLGGIEQVEDGKVLDGKDFVHSFEAEAALAVQEI